MSFFRRGPLSRHDYLAMDRLPGLDGLRALAVLTLIGGLLGGSAWTTLTVHYASILIGCLLALVLPDDGTVRAVAVSLVALGMAELLHRWVETPAISCGRRLAQPPVSAEHRADARTRISAG